MRRQHQVALRNDYTFLRTPAQVREFVKKDRLEPLVSNQHLHVNNVSFPYARPEVKLFVERLAQQYHEANGTRLVVTSLTRPLSRQPRNAHRLSVHPAGMAVDLRVPPTRKSRGWLESVLLQLEARGLLDATRERHPPHYHVAVFPDKYGAYAARLIEREERERAEALADAGTDTEHATSGEAETLVAASLEPTDSSHSAHDAEGVEQQGESVATMGAASAGVPTGALAGALGLAGILLGGAGLARRRARRNG